MPAWVRVRLPGVGTWSQRDDAPMREGSEVLDGVEALDPTGRPLPDAPEAAIEGASDEDFGDWLEGTNGPAVDDAAETSPATQAGATAEKAATTPGDTKAGTPTPTGTTSPIKE